MDKLVSVVMSTYNESLCIIEKSIQSILNQTYQNIELIVINDNPRRYDLDVFLSTFSARNSNFLYYKNEENVGLVHSLNFGIKKSHGYYIARMDADDISLPERIEIQVNYINDNDLDFIGCSAITINENEKIIGEIKVPQSTTSILHSLKYGNCILHPTWLLKKNIYDSLEGYRDVYSCEDYDFILRAIRGGYKIGNVPELLLKYRVRSNGISVSNESQQKLTMYFLQSNFRMNKIVSIEELQNYLASNYYLKDLSKMNNYIESKNNFKNKDKIKIKLSCLMQLASNRYFYKIILSKILLYRIKRRGYKYDTNN